MEPTQSTMDELYNRIGVGSSVTTVQWESGNPIKVFKMMDLVDAQIVADPTGTRWMIYHRVLTGRRWARRVS